MSDRKPVQIITIYDNCTATVEMVDQRTMYNVIKVSNTISFAQDRLSSMPIGYSFGKPIHGAYKTTVDCNFDGVLNGVTLND